MKLSIGNIFMLIGLMFIATIPAKSQNSKFQFGGAINYGLQRVFSKDQKALKESSNLPFQGIREWKTSLDFGLIVEYPINDFFNLGIGLQYNQGGYIYDIREILIGASIPEGQEFHRYTNHFMAIPLSIKCFPWKAAQKLFTGITLAPNYNFRNTLYRETHWKTFVEVTEKHLDLYHDYRKVNLDVEYRVGYDFPINAKLHLPISIGIKSQVAPLQKNDFYKKRLWLIGLKCELFFS